MCGIIGSVSVGIDDARFSAALGALRHRGPDAEGTATPAPGVRLGHARLSIMDVSDAGRQPFCDPGNRLWAVVNGEIYNHMELRAELERAGRVFVSRSDCEVVIHGYAEWGDEVVERLRGIFALAVYDGCRNRLLLARDAAGVKPMYYCRAGEGILFSSELKGLLAALPGQHEVDPQAIWSYLSYRYVPGEMTPYAGFHKLLPAHLLVWENGKIDIRRWWQPGILTDRGDWNVMVRSLRATLQESVDAQLMSDVPVGVLLSGGIDSSAITALVSRHVRGVEAFCCGFKESGYDERPYARLTAEICGATLHETVMDQDTLIASIPEYVGWFDEPFFDYSAIAVNRLCRMARERGIKVLLAGDGADELFAGYLWYDSFVEGSASDSGRGLEDYFSLLGYFTRSDLCRLAGREIDFDHLWLFRSLDRPGLLPVNRGQWLDFKTFLPDDILVKVDRASMAAGVEVRVPFLDSKMLQNCFLWPQQVVYRNGERKAILKRALSGILPESILTSRKKGFGFPLEIWSARIRAFAEPLLGNGLLVAHGYASPAGMQDALRRHGADRVWLLLTAELWLRSAVAGEDMADLVESFVRRQA